MKINSVNKQSFGINPSNIVRLYMGEAALAGKDIRPLIQAMKDIYPYKYMTILADSSKKVQAVGITDKFDSAPTIKYVLPGKWQRKFEELRKNHFYSGDYYRKYNAYLHEDEAELYKKHATQVIVPNIYDETYKMLFSDIKGKPFIKIIDTITEKLQKIKESFTPKQRIANEIEKEFPEYKRFVTQQEAQDISGRAARSINPRIG